MESTKEKWASLSPQTQVEVPSHTSEEARVPLTETPMILSVRRPEKSSPHIHKHHLDAAVKVQEIQGSSFKYLHQVKGGFAWELRGGALINQPQPE